ncbi:MAG: carboxypeptidase regulatory-like domain-containing protein [Candidatus Latescibacteria bacterium]|nr:carboxypeptidase regulatory-like domain-containing protein [Candidatus Latescibacterota bacterium]
MPRQIILLAVFSMMTVLFLSCSETEMVEQVNGPTTLVSGSVIYENNPVDGADIFVFHQTGSYFNVDISCEKIAQTGSDGIFSFEVKQDELPQKELESLNIAALHEDYSVGWVKLYKDDELSGIVITLDEQDTITGIIRDTKGKPIRDAVINIGSIRMDAVSPRTFGNGVYIEGALPGTSVTTGRSGKFALKHLPKESAVNILVKAPGYAQYYNQRVQAGSDGIPITLEKESRIKGKIIFGDFAQQNDSMILIAIGGSMMGESAESTVDKNGEFLFTNLKEGTYEIGMIPKDKFPDFISELVEDVKVTAGETTDNIEVRLIKGAVISGKVINNDTGEPIPDIFIGRGGFTDENGEFKTRVQPGEIRLYCHSQKGYELVSDKEILIDAVEGETYTGLDFLMKKGQEIQGFVRTVDGKPVGNAVITASAPRNVGTRSDRKGHFALTGIQAGHEITITAEQQELQLQASTNILVVKPDMVVDILMEKYDTTHIEGRVIDTQGSPAAGIEISLLMIDNVTGQSMSTSVAVSGKNGSFSIPGLKVGNKYRIMIQKDQSKTEMFVAKADMEPFELVLP